MSSTIILAPASQVFVDTRTTSLGPWVLGGFMDCILMGIILCQVRTFFSFRQRGDEHAMRRLYLNLVLLVTFLSLLKTAQSIAIVWVQNVTFYANPDVARNLVNEAWWQVSAVLMTGLTGSVVQSFFAFRFYKLSRSIIFTIPIVCAIILGLTSISFATYSITHGLATAKVFWLLAHFVSVFIADLLITSGTTYTLKKRNTGLAATSSLINRTLRIVFESAIPPTFIATVDLILTQTLGPHLLWHLFINYALSKVYVISFLFTLNCIVEHRREQTSRSRTRSGDHQNRLTRRDDVELGERSNFSNTSGPSNILVQTHVTTHHDILFVPQSYTIGSESFKESHPEQEDGLPGPKKSHLDL